MEITIQYHIFKRILRNINKEFLPNLSIKFSAAVKNLLFIFVHNPQNPILKCQRTPYCVSNELGLFKSR